MTNTDLLLKHVHDSGLKLKFIAESLGITPFGLSNKIHNKTEFKATEIRKMKELLNLSNEERDKIFFN